MHAHAYGRETFEHRDKPCSLAKMRMANRGTGGDFPRAQWCVCLQTGKAPLGNTRCKLTAAPRRHTRGLYVAERGSLMHFNVYNAWH